MIISFIGSKGSPGVTNLITTLALAWPTKDKVLVLDGDPSGGDFAARLNLSHEKSIVSLCASPGPISVDLLSRHVQVYNQCAYLVGVRDSRSFSQVKSSLIEVINFLKSKPQLELDVLVDLGRYNPGDETQIEMIKASDCIIVVCNERPEAIGAACNACELVKSLGKWGAIVVIGRKKVAQRCATVVPFPILAVVNKLSVPGRYNSDRSTQKVFKRGVEREIKNLITALREAITSTDSYRSAERSVHSLFRRSEIVNQTQDFRHFPEITPVIDDLELLAKGPGSNG